MASFYLVSNSHSNTAPYCIIKISDSKFVKKLNKVFSFLNLLLVVSDNKYSRTILVLPISLLEELNRY